MPKPNISLLIPPSVNGDIRANVSIKAGPTADALRELAETYQLDPASLIRLLAIEALEARKARK